jgi:hypothetical protein
VRKGIVVWVIDLTFLLIYVELKHYKHVLSWDKSTFLGDKSAFHIRVNLY